MIQRRRLGRLGEHIACSHLRKLGYVIIAKNYTTPIGEVDIIAEDGDTIAFVEVKMRSSDTHGYPEEAVNYKKMRKLTKLAALFIKTENVRDRRIRFDVIAIVRHHRFGKKSIKLIKDAFYAIDQLCSQR